MLVDQNPWWRRFASCERNRLITVIESDSSLWGHHWGKPTFGIHVILWSMSTLDLKQNPPRRICTHVFAASHDATCSECYRGIWLPLSLPCSKMFFLPFRPHEMLQSLVQILQYFEQHYWHRNSNLSWMLCFEMTEVLDKSVSIVQSVESWLDSFFWNGLCFQAISFVGEWHQNLNCFFNINI